MNLESMGEELRILYVAMTRQRKSCSSQPETGIWATIRKNGGDLQKGESCRLHS